MTHTIKKVNNWGILSLFNSYLKHNKSIIFSMILVPIIFIAAAAANYTVIFQGNVSGALILMILWLVQSASFAIQTFVAMILDFKQTIIYRRIGLTRIKKINFLIMATIFNLILMLLSNLFIFSVIVILAIAFQEYNFLNSIFQWQFALMILFTLACLILLTGVALLMAVFIKSRTGQTIAGLIVNFLIVIPLYILIFFLHSFASDTNAIIDKIGLFAFLGTFFAIFIFINLISVLLYYISWKYFKWYE